MNFGGMNPPAILAAALLAFGFGLLFHRLARAAAAWPPPSTLLAMLAAYGLAAWVLAGTLGHLGVGQVTLRNGLISAGFVWAGFALTALTVSLRLNGLSWRVLLAEAAHWLAAMLLMGAVIGAIGV
jgi:hypothetical protein